MRCERGLSRLEVASWKLEHKRACKASSQHCQLGQGLISHRDAQGSHVVGSVKQWSICVQEQMSASTPALSGCFGANRGQWGLRAAVLRHKLTFQFSTSPGSSLRIAFGESNTDFTYKTAYLSIFHSSQKFCEPLSVPRFIGSTPWNHSSIGIKSETSSSSGGCRDVRDRI